MKSVVKSFVLYILHQKPGRAAGIARVTAVSEPWLQKYVNTKYAEIPHQVEVSDQPKGKIIIECDEVGAVVSRREPAGEFAPSHL